WFLEILPLETAQTDFGAVRRAVISAGNPTQFAELRLCTARVEARKGNLMEAARHWGVAHRLLLASPHAKLESQLWLNASMIALLRGDSRTALENVDQAAHFAELSGYFRTAIGTEIDRAHVLFTMGKSDEGLQLAERAVRTSEPYPQLHVAALDCLAGIQIG